MWDKAMRFGTLSWDIIAVMKVWDVFISHAGEDKAEVAHPLAEQLTTAGLRVWHDRHEIHLGDSLREKIDEGLASCTFGVVVLSEAFLAKHWPTQELNGLAAREDQGRKVILPVWHRLHKQQLAAASPMLADRVAVDTAKGIPAVAAAIATEVFRVYFFVIGSNHEMILLPLLDETSRYAFALSKHPTTNEQYKRFCLDASHESPTGEAYDKLAGSWRGPFSPWSDPQYNRPDQPVVCVSLHDAEKYCSWLARTQGFRSVASITLPSPIVWDFAALGESEQDVRNAIFSRTQTVHHRADFPAPIDDGGSRANLFGISDLFGNIFEWCSARFVLAGRIARLIGKDQDRIVRRASKFVDSLPYPLTLTGISLRKAEPLVFGGIGALGGFPLAAPKWRREYLVKGGSFLDDLQRVVPVADASELPNKTHTKHSDLGFRVCALVDIQNLPRSVQERLSDASRVERAQQSWSWR